MSLAFVISSLLVAQASPVVMPAERQEQQRDVAFEQIATGQTDAAIAALEAALGDRPDDPAILLNLGAAYLQAGDLGRANEAYSAAAASDERYRVELADGDWMDSRRAANLALGQLEQRRLAMR